MVPVGTYIVPKKLAVVPVQSDLPGSLVSRWEFSDEDIAFLLKNKYIYFYIATFGQPMQPVMLHCEEPEITFIDERAAGREPSAPLGSYDPVSGEVRLDKPEAVATIELNTID
jgi:hypothetical protein